MNTATVALREIPQEYKKFNLKDAVTDVLRSVNDKTRTKRKASGSTALERAAALEISKALLSSFSPEMMEICESYHCTKLTTQFKNLSKLAEGQAGTRPIYLSKYGNRMLGFEFNSQSRYKKSFNAKYHIRQGSRRDQVIIHFPAFVPDKSFERSKEATNFKINARLVALSDFRYDSNEKLFKPLNTAIHGKFSSYNSGMLPILKIPLDPMTSQLCLNQTVVPDGTSLFLIMAISFYMYDNGRFVHLCKDGCMQIKSVF